MTDARILDALGLPTGGTEAAIAEGLRRLAGLPPGGGRDPALWMRVLAGVDMAVRHGDERVDLALFAHGIASHAIAPLHDPDEERFGARAWDVEIGVADGESDERLRELAMDEIAPRLWDARLVYIINYV